MTFPRGADVREACLSGEHSITVIEGTRACEECELPVQTLVNWLDHDVS
jgi:hypothetical protein